MKFPRLNLQRIFYVEDSLESAVAGERVAQLIARTEQVCMGENSLYGPHLSSIHSSYFLQLLRQRAFLRDERRRLRISTDKIEERKNALSIIQRADWLPETLKPTAEAHVLINVGGLVRSVLFVHYFLSPLLILPAQ